MDEPLTIIIKNVVWFNKSFFSNHNERLNIALGLSAKHFLLYSSEAGCTATCDRWTKKLRQEEKVWV